MPPKLKFTREEIVENALSIVREGGMAALTARSLGAALGSSPKPVFGLFKNMDEVQREVLGSANALYQDFLRTEMVRGEYPPYKASGMAYIAFARREPELFKLLFMRDRRHESITEHDGSIDGIISIISAQTGLSESDARLFHLEMWIFVHGMASMIVTGYLDWDTEYVSRALSDAYEGIGSRFMEKRK